jgi:thiamine-phosphate pyrophosphorylase
LRQVDFDIYLITDRRLCGEKGLVSGIESALKGGVRAVQLREKDLSGRELYELGNEIRAVTAQYGAKLFVNGDAALAHAIGADGVHLPQDGLPPNVCRKALEPHMLIGVSTHGLAEAVEAEKQGADFITFGPVCYTESKAKYGPPVGVEALRSICEQSALPVFALGGVTASNAAEVMSCGASGVGAISAILAASDPEAAAFEILNKTRGARPAEIIDETFGE